VVQGGTLTSDTFQNYTPHCSFNKDGTIKQETLNAVNELLNLATPGPPQKVETEESDVSDDITKMRESEIIRHQEQAIEEAETLKVHSDMYIFFLWRYGPTQVMASSFLRFLDHTTMHHSQ
jgi:hypothetical protein